MAPSNKHNSEMMESKEESTVAVAVAAETTPTGGINHTAYFELAPCDRWMFAAAAVGAWGPVVIFGALRNTVYIVYFGAPAGAIGAVGIFMGWWNALNGPFIAKWSDAGYLNKLRIFSPAESWGRRAPWLLSGTPLVILGTSLMWLPPSHEDNWLVAWYALCYFLVINGVTMQLQAYLASVQELFTTGVARGRAIARQAPFLTGAFLMAGVLPLIVFTFTPDTTTKCCIAPRSGCPTGDLPCICFRDAEDLHGISEHHDHSILPPAPPPLPPFMPGLYNATDAHNEQLHAQNSWSGLRPETWTSPLEAFSPEYSSSCAAGINYTMIEATAARSLACGIGENMGRENVQTWRFMIAAVMVAGLGCFALLAIRPTRKTPVALADSEVKPLNLFTSMKATMSLHPFRLFAAIQFLSQCYGTHVTSNFSLYLVYVIGLGPNELGGLLFVLTVTVIATRLASLPFFVWLLKHVHPATLFSILRFSEAFLVPGFFALLKVEGINSTALIAVAALGSGVIQSPNDMINHMMMGWAIDEDGVKRKGLRREGMFWACNGVCQHLSEVVIALLLAVFGAAGFDPRLCASDQPPTAIQAIEYSFLLGAPLVLFTLSFLAYLYPIRGERLAKLKADVAAMDAQRVERLTNRSTGVRSIGSKGEKCLVDVDRHSQGTAISRVSPAGSESDADAVMAVYASSGPPELTGQATGDLLVPKSDNPV